MLYQTQNEINAFYCFVIQKVASSNNVKVPDFDLKSTVELLQEISTTAPGIHKLLQNFLSAYQSWYDVHAQINNAGTSGNLTVQQDQLLMQAIQKRDFTRVALINAM